MSGHKALARLRGGAVSAGARPCPEINHYLPKTTPFASYWHANAQVWGHSENKSGQAAADSSFFLFYFFILHISSLPYDRREQSSLKVLELFSKQVRSGEVLGSGPASARALQVFQLLDCCQPAVSSVILKTTFAKEGNTNCVKTLFLSKLH